ncbi:hypothetical protein BHE90_016976 [Fusarium euwallaceae]|uniref:PD-(D/E)XK nuclease-like domain-containing protein n=1 Tax=Fusarium euwallaceae TaxID=1147111 RepID=A0A430KYV7_9HYPO|nr:hypothetical protein BHE90_016976 [Fusarium euwallaceae]
MKYQRIIEWISQTNLGCDWSHHLDDKAEAHHHPLSPPATQDTHRKHKRTMSERSGQSAKRPRIESSEDENDEYLDEVDKTPRPHSNILRQHSFPSESQSQTSGRSSPSKQMNTLELSGFKWNQQLSLANPDIPDELFEFLTEIVNCNNGIGIISQDEKAQIAQRAQSNRSYRLFQDVMFEDRAVRDAIGPTPLIDDVEWIVAEARECQEFSHPEASWNEGVHFPLLHKAVYGPRRKRQRVGVGNCTTAKLIREYLPKNTLAKRVDYSFFIDPGADTSPTSKSPAEAVADLRKVMPCQVINHTAYRPFRDRPMVVTVETKKRYGSQEGAELQTGTWHAAHWEFLARRIEKTGGTFEELPFLPGILIQGHDWSFVATTREESKTVVWLEQKFGYTNDTIGVYKAIWGVQRLARWVDDVYWPWYKKNVLCL